MNFQLFIWPLLMGILKLSNILFRTEHQRKFAKQVNLVPPSRHTFLNREIDLESTFVLSLLLLASSMDVCSHERTPMDEAVSRGKMDVINAINMMVAQVELDDVNIS
ncbi:hypothetical protein BHE74_00040119 [Ensete ventricosum]|nr:hypothetical protein GW17_00036233 [Ensete ventricosum]RWW53394.1 hypothetical protein BHE74_00040119 [Ensete ventricosum]